MLRPRRAIVVSTFLPEVIRQILNPNLDLSSGDDSCFLISNTFSKETWIERQKDEGGSNLIWRFRLF